MMRIFLLAILVLACKGPPKDNVPHQTMSDVEQVAEKYADYQKMALLAGDAYGFFGPHCDSLLFTALAAYAGIAVDVYKAEKSAGEWQRHPSFETYPGECDSSISKDQLLGLLVYLGGAKDSRAAERIISYGEAHNFIMGSAKDDLTKLSKTLMSAQLIRDYQHLAKRSSSEEKKHGSEKGGVKDGYLGHLDVLHIYASYLVFGGISDSELASAQAYCAHSPRNALYCGVYHRFSDGDFSSVMPILLDEDLFPSDHLPTSKGRCSDYLWQRDDSEKDWGPCPEEGRQHQGIDFLIAAKIVTATF